MAGDDPNKFSEWRREVRSPEALERRRSQRLDYVSVTPPCLPPPPPPDDLLLDAERREGGLGRIYRGGEDRLPAVFRCRHGGRERAGKPTAACA